MNINGSLKRLFFVFAILASFAFSVAEADILNWQTGETIRGTEGIIPGPGMNVSFRNTDERNLRFANFQALNLSGARFDSSWLDNSGFSQANLTNALLSGATLTGADLSQANLTNADLWGATLAS